MSVFKVALLVLLLVLASACGSSHHAAAPRTSSTVPLPRRDVIAAVKSSFGGKALAFFPNRQTRIRCRIPGAVAMAIEGTCQTKVAFTGSSKSALVTFTEYWPARRFRTHGPPKGTLHHFWRFRVNPAIIGGPPSSVRPLGGGGALPPQASD